MQVSDILDAVEQWAQGYWMIRETGAAMSGDPHENEGRMDAILVPVNWEAVSYLALKFGQGIIGVEVKRFRHDFLNGLKSGQYDRYADKPSVCGLYLATEKGVCKTSEVPARFGHINVSQRYVDGHPFMSCSCRRNPTWKEAHLDPPTLWRTLWSMYREHRVRGRKYEEEQHRIMKRVRERMGELVAATAREARRLTTEPK